MQTISVDDWCNDEDWAMETIDVMSENSDEDCSQI